MSQHCSVCVVGESQSGKSTLIGHLLYQNNDLHEDLINKAKIYQQPQKVFSSALSPHKAEHEPGITRNINKKLLNTKNFQITLTDTPGIQKKIKSVIRAITSSDVILLVITPSNNEESKRNNKTYGIIAYTLGIRKIIICINKMDENDNYSKFIFNVTSKRSKKLFTQIGFKSENITILPISAFNGDNLTEKSTNLSWWQGKTLLKELTAITLPERQREAPFRMPIEYVYRIKGIGTVIAGTIAYGTTTVDNALTLLPKNLKTINKSIESYLKPQQIATAGDYIGININHLRFRDFSKGDVVVEDMNISYKTNTFLAQIVTLKDSPKKMKLGYSPILHCHTSYRSCRITKLISIIDKKSQKVLEEYPLQINRYQSAIVEFTPDKPIWLESYDIFPKLGRFILTDRCLVIGVGIVKEVTSLTKGRRTKAAI